MTTLALLLRYWREAVIVALVAFLMLECHARDEGLIAKGKAEQRAHVADSLLAVAAPAKARAETTLVHDTLRLSRLLIAANVDTAWRHDTLHVPGDSTPRVAVPIRTVAWWDSVGSACSALAHDCLAFRDSANAVIAALNQKLAAELPAHPPPSRTRWFTAGAIVGRSSCYVASPHPFP